MNYLDLLQKINNFLYKIFGANGLVVDLQVKINTKRAEKDISDPNDLIDGFAQ